MRNFWMNLRKKRSYLYISFFSIAFFVLFMGVKVLDPTNTEWLLQGGLDISQHYAGWMFFRKDAWMFPIGDFTSLSYPNRMSIIYLDSIPLFAVAFKIFHNFLPENFQYFGWYQLLCFVLQGIFGVKIISKYIKNEVGRFLAGTLFVMTPVFLWRVFLHVALSSHWIILLALSSIFYYYEYFAENKKHKILFWMMLGFFCTTIHLYFMPMCFIILCGFLYLDFRRRHQIKDMLFTMGGFWIGIILPMFLLGGFIKGVNVSQENIVWKKSFNLNNFVNSQGWSRVLPKMPLHSYGQSEGFAYLGMGVFFCAIFAAAVFISLLWKNCKIKELYSNPKIHALTLIFIISIIAAASPEITFGTKNIILPVPEFVEKIWSIFRACGRLVWPAVYIIMICSCIVLSKCRRKEVFVLGMGLCAFTQFIDISGEIWGRGEMARETCAFSSSLKEAGWKAIGENKEIKNIVYVNVSGLSDCASMAEFANQYDKTLSRFYYARKYDSVIDRSMKESLHNKDKKDIFLFDQNRMIDAWNEPDLHYYILDDKLLGYCEEIAELKEKQVDVKEYSYSYLCNNLENAIHSEMIDGFLFIHAGGSYESPVFELPKGTYRFEIAGENMADCEVSAVIPDMNAFYITEKAMQTIEGNITCKEHQTIKLKINNPSDHDMVLYQIEMKMVLR